MVNLVVVVMVVRMGVVLLALVVLDLVGAVGEL